MTRTSSSVPTVAAATLAALTTLAALLLLSPVAASAQGAGADSERDAGAARTHAGFWLSGGLGGGLDDAGDGGGGGYLRMGGTLSQHVVIGGDALAWSHEQGNATVTRATATFDVLFYPSITAGGFLKAGIGFSDLSVSRDIQGVTVSADDGGAGAVLGAGWDIRLGEGNLYLTPNVDVMLQGFDGLDTIDAVYLFTIGIGFH
ncbi:MAG TPA: hypothetical protein VKA44_06195 [Gemmatimonadota bacterium]|nr:hypothetical protein [Gemmatimonadota bacterium]